MIEAIPGLDASLYIDREGHSFWAINKDWRAPERIRNASRKGKGKGRDTQTVPDGQAGIWDSVAERGIFLDMAENSDG